MEWGPHHAPGASYSYPLDASRILQTRTSIEGPSMITVQCLISSTRLRKRTGVFGSTGKPKLDSNPTPESTTSNCMVLFTNSRVDLCWMKFALSVAQSKIVIQAKTKMLAKRAFRMAISILSGLHSGQLSLSWFPAATRVESYTRYREGCFTECSQY